MAEFVETSIPGVIIVEPRVFRDARGFFLETYHAGKYREGGIAEPFVQDNHSLSSQGTLRGLHAQVSRPQGKLVRVIEGRIFDVAADVRPGSPTFGEHVATELSSDDHRQVYVPPGFVHGFCVLSERAQVEYKCTDLYEPGDEIVIAWNDPDLAIDWPIESPLLSAKDEAGLRLADARERLAGYSALVR